MHLSMQHMFYYMLCLLFFSTSVQAEEGAAGPAAPRGRQQRAPPGPGARHAAHFLPGGAAAGTLLQKRKILKCLFFTGFFQIEMSP